MKNLLLTLTLFFSFSINAQYAVMYAVDLNEGAEEDSLKLEEFWSEIHKEVIKYIIRKEFIVFRFYHGHIFTYVPGYIYRHIFNSIVPFKIHK